MEHFMTNLRSMNKFSNLHRNLKNEVASFLLRNEKVSGFMNVNKKVRKEMKDFIGNPFKVANYLGYLKGNVYMTNKEYFNFLGDHQLFEILLTKFEDLELDEILKGCEIYISDSLKNRNNKTIKLLLTLSNNEENDFYSQLLDLPEMETNKEFMCFSFIHNELTSEKDLGILKKIKLINCLSINENTYKFFNYLINNNLRITFKKFSIDRIILPCVLEYFRLFPNQLVKIKFDNSEFF